MAEEVDKKLFDRLAHIEIAIKSINPDPDRLFRRTASNATRNNALQVC